MMRTALLLVLVGTVDAQGAAMVGGRPPKSVVTALCSISDVFAHMCDANALHVLYRLQLLLAPPRPPAPNQVPRVLCRERDFHMRALRLKKRTMSISQRALTTAAHHALACTAAKPSLNAWVSRLTIHTNLRRTEITTDPNCMAGCAHGTGICPTQWYPGRADECSPDCGRVYEPFCEKSASSCKPSVIAVLNLHRNTL